jgi:NADH-quinone oxidoreductase subunit L
MPQTFWLFVIGTLSLAGVPLFAGFVSKEEILGVTLAGGLMVPFVLLLAGTFLTAFYMTRIVALAFFGAPRDEHAAHAHEAKATMTGPMWVLGVSAIFIGLLPFIHHDAPEAVPPVWLTPLAMALAFGGIGIGWLTYGSRTISADMLASLFAPMRYAAERKFWLDDLYLAIYRYGLMTFSRAIGWLDRYIVDGVLNVVSAWTLDAGDALRRVQTGKVQDYIVAVGLGLLALLLWMRGTL